MDAVALPPADHCTRESLSEAFVLRFRTRKFCAETASANAAPKRTNCLNMRRRRLDFGRRASVRPRPVISKDGAAIEFRSATEAYAVAAADEFALWSTRAPRRSASGSVSRRRGRLSLAQRKFVRIVRPRRGDSCSNAAPPTPLSLKIARIGRGNRLRTLRPARRRRRPRRRRRVAQRIDDQKKVRQLRGARAPANVGAGELLRATARDPGRRTAKLAECPVMARFLHRLK